MKNHLYLSMIAAFFVSNIALADEYSADVQAKLSNELGSCYKKLADNLTYCTPFSCNYPDLTDSKAWKAKVIRGMFNEKCYVISYSYVGNKIIGDPDHCFYDNQQQNLLTSLYNGLFSTDSVLQVRDLQDRIIQLNASVCKKVEKKDTTTAQ